MNRLSMKRYSFILVIFSFFLFNLNAQDNTNSGTNNTKNNTTVDSTSNTTGTQGTISGNNNNYRNQTSINNRSDVQNASNQLENPKFATNLANDLKRKVKLSADQTDQVRQVLEDYQSQINTAILEKNNFAGIVLFRDYESSFAGVDLSNQRAAEEQKTGTDASVTYDNSTGSTGSTGSGTTGTSGSVSGSISGNTRVESSDVRGTTTPPNTTGSGSLGTNQPGDINTTGSGSSGTSGSVSGSGSISESTGTGASGSFSGSTGMSGSVSGSTGSTGSSGYDRSSPNDRAAAMSNIYSDDRMTMLEKADEQADSRIESILDNTQKEKYSNIKDTWWANVRQQAVGKNWAAATSKEEHMKNRQYDKHRRSNSTAPGINNNSDRNNNNNDDNRK